jgi:chemotaxis protein methyltransferase CheR
MDEGFPYDRASSWSASEDTRNAHLREWICDLLSRRFGLELPEQRLPQLVEHLRTLACELGSARVEDCLSMLPALPLEAPVVQRLIEQATSKETYFFRDAATVESLRERILPSLISRATTTRTLRVWSAGCATGEELYTIAILLRELIPDYDAWQITLLGSDIDQRALGHARQASYDAWSLRSTAGHTRLALFEPVGDRFVLKQQHRQNTAFALHNLADSEAPLPAPGRFDLILCRNVTIHFSLAAQERTAALIARALAPDGVWLAGPSDPLPRTGFLTEVYAGVMQLRPHERRSSAPPAQRADPSSSFSCAVREQPTNVAPTELAAEVRAQAREASRESARELELSAIRALADVGRTRDALERLNDLTTRHSLWAAPYLLRAIVREASGDLAGMADDLARALCLDPEHVEARLRLGLTQARMGEHERASNTLRLAVSASCQQADLPELRALAAQQLVRMLRKGRTR